MDLELEYIDQLPQVKVDFETKKLWIDGHEVKLIKKLSFDPNSKLITVEKHRVYVPNFLFEKPWENFFGSDKPDMDESVEDWDKNRSSVFLDKSSRKPLIYTFIIDSDNNLYIKSKEAEK